MKITKEQFSRLKQLDRIEFRQRYKEYEDTSSVTLGLAWDMFFILGFLMLLIPLYQLAYGKDVVISLFHVFPIIIVVFKVAIIICVATDIISMIYNYVQRKRIINEYFKVEVKK
jgi:hypothetical protein